MITLDTGVVITYDKKGNIKTLQSPYYSKKKNNAVRGGVLRYLEYKIKKIIK